ncbi:hypothetical protein SOVF_213590 [Spinacia oleracea]|uniref:RING-H2 finger protein ATL33-like n=1 Tax=Spinacia oleracea TaxID=3562 RepID=A0A9R0K6A9_SPIOL|nr:RING-H2 finger protein ATL33-like [Spinacia oleracea]KNA02964.1 hypothetical protein SOVF_213590 [Spinacia oleracea]
MMSSVSLIVMLLIMIIIPTVLYSFFFITNCPLNLFGFLCGRRGSPADIDNFDQTNKVVEQEEGESTSDKDKNNIELVIDVNSKLGKDEECPICLAVFIQGDELRQLNSCKHLFHRSCIDKWLSTHCNCPVCRAFIVNNQSKPIKEREHNRVLVSREVDRHDHWQGLPDSAGMI